MSRVCFDHSMLLFGLFVHTTRKHSVIQSDFFLPPIPALSSSLPAQWFSLSLQLLVHRLRPNTDSLLALSAPPGRGVNYVLINGAAIVFIESVINGGVSLVAHCHVAKEFRDLCAAAEVLTQGLGGS